MYPGATAGHLLELMKDADQAYRRAVVYPAAARQGLLSHDLEHLCAAPRHGRPHHRAGVLARWLNRWRVRARTRVRNPS